MNKKILFLLPYPLGQAPSQRFRVEAYFHILDKAGYGYTTKEFLNTAAWKVLYQKSSALQKLFAVLKGFLKRLFTILFIAPSYDFVFIHREAAPLGPPFFEWLLAKVLRKRIIYDFDDAIWIPNITEENRLARYFKCFWKVSRICKWSYKVSVGNDFLGSYAGQFNKQVVYNPTCVDTEQRYNIMAGQHANPVTIGWTGSHSTIQFFAVLYPVLKKMEAMYRFRLLVICDRKPDFDLESMEFIPWNKETEIEDLAKINIGIMPLKKDAWSEGKCGFKIIQYLSTGIPAVASNVGVNNKIIDQGENGYICETEEEWINALAGLMQNEQKRIEFGMNGRKKMIEKFSIASNTETFLSLFTI